MTANRDTLFDAKKRYQGVATSEFFWRRPLDEPQKLLTPMGDGWVLSESWQEISNNLGSFAGFAEAR